MDKIPRKDFLNTLKIVSPALSDNTLIPVMTHFWFTGTHVMAFNDQIAIRTPLATPFKGAVPGETLLSLLSASIGKNVTFTEADGNLTIACGKSRIHFSLLPPDAFVFDMPKLPDVKVTITNKKSLLSSIELCMGSVSNDTTVPDQLGVTLLHDDNNLFFFSTDGQTMTQSKSTGKQTFVRAILGAMFCQQLIRFGDKIDALYVRAGKENFALATAGETSIYGQLIESEKPVPYREMFDHHVKEKELKALYYVPPSLDYIVKRAVVITDSPHDQTATNIEATDHAINFSSASILGRIEDKIDKDMPPQPRVKIKLRMKHVKKAMENGFNKMLLTERCLIMSKDQTFFLVAAMHGDNA